MDNALFDEYLDTRLSVYLSGSFNIKDAVFPPKYNFQSYSANAHLFSKFDFFFGIMSPNCGLQSWKRWHSEERLVVVRFEATSPTGGIWCLPNWKQWNFSQPFGRREKTQSQSSRWLFDKLHVRKQRFLGRQSQINAGKETPFPPIHHPHAHHPLPNISLALFPACPKTTTLK